MSILRADSIRDRSGTGAPDFPNGLTGNVTGTATTATNAQGITGTPNITVGTVTGTDATFSGNLTVNGTTTTIDTAVTAVDSLNVEGSVGIGTITPTKKLEVAVGNSASDGILLKGNSSPAIQIDEGSGVSANFALDGNGSYFGPTSNHYQVFRTNSAERLRITSGGTAIFKGGLAEKYNSISGNLASNTNHSIFNGNVIAFAVGDTGTSLTINFTDVHATLSQQEFCSFTVILDPGGAGKITTVQIDGQSPAGGLKWSGGSAPSAGASGYDVYTFALQKYGTAANNYIVYGAATNYD
jgi:hypothetical protein